MFARIDNVLYGYLAQAFKKFDHEEFDLQTMAQSRGRSTVSDWAEDIEVMIKRMKSRCIIGFEDPEAYLKGTSSGIFWADVEVIFNQSMNRSRYGPESGPVAMAGDLIYTLLHSINRYSVLVTDLLPELVEREQFDLQMKAALRRKWAILDSILDCWFQGDRENGCTVPHW